jgi:putative aldouronate transport system permease protein
MVGNKRISVRIFSIFNIMIISALCFVCLLPMIHVLMGSFSSPLEAALERGFILFPKGEINIEAYRIILDYTGVWSGYRNTIIYVVVQCAITGFFSILGGYILSRKEFRYKGIFMVFLIVPMLFNGGLIPTFMVIQRIGLIDTFWVMVLPGAMSTFYFILMRIAMDNVPDSLQEAAKIDGASELRIMFQIVLPLCMSTLAIILLFTAVGKWNDYFSALIYLQTRRDLYPLQLYLREILSSASNLTSATQVVENASLYDQIVQYALIVVSSAPILLIYPFAQKYFVKGIMLGGIKG